MPGFQDGPHTAWWALSQHLLPIPAIEVLSSWVAGACLGPRVGGSLSSQCPAPVSTRTLWCFQSHVVSGAAEAQVVTLRQTVKRVKQRSGDHDWGRTCSPGLPLLVYFQSVVPRREGWIKLVMAALALWWEKRARRERHRVTRTREPDGNFSCSLPVCPPEAELCFQRDSSDQACWVTTQGMGRPVWT